MKVKPCRYHHALKKTMSNLISALLKDGLIVPNNNSFSSLVLSVKKKNDTWRVCVGYKGLNVVTIKDSFPIPAIDKLLDELDGVSIFLKTDLGSDYHQIHELVNSLASVSNRHK